MERFQIICLSLSRLQASSDEESGREHHNDIGDDGYLADDEESDNDVTSGQAVSTCCMFAREVLNRTIR